MYIHESIKTLNLFIFHHFIDIDFIRAIQSVLSICDYQSRFTAIHFIQFARRRALLKRIFTIRSRTNYITRARESRLNEVGVLRHRLLESAHFIAVSCATPRYQRETRIILAK